MTAAGEEETVAVPEPVAEVATEPTPVEQVATVTGKVAVQSEDAASWFWDLLATTCYEEC